MSRLRLPLNSQDHLRTFFVDSERYDGSWELPGFLAYLTGRIQGPGLREPWQTKRYSAAGAQD